MQKPAAFEDKETTLTDCKQRIAKAVAFLQIVTPAQIDGSEDKETRCKGMKYLLVHGLPNFYLHVTTTYNILCHNGIEIGKRDYLGTPLGKP